MKTQEDTLGRKVQNYTGTRDFFGEEARWRNWVTDQIRSSFQTFGFEPLETPMIETDMSMSITPQCCLRIEPDAIAKFVRVARSRRSARPK